MIVPRTLLTFAQEHALSSCTEVEHRAAISRAYYAAYRCAKAVAEAEGRRFSSNADAHNEVRAYLDRNDAVLGRYFSTLKRLRRRVDYDLNVGQELISTDAASCIELAGDILDLAG